MMQAEPIKIYHKSCLGLVEMAAQSTDALITDPPYGIAYQGHEWDKQLPDAEIWAAALNVLKPGAFGLVFSSIRLMHRLMVQLEDAGFLIKDVLMWAYLNGMPKTKNIGLTIDQELGIESLPDGHYNYVMGYKKGGADSYTLKNHKTKFTPASTLGKQYNGAGLGLKPAYEPIILIQKPLEKKCTVAQNIIKYGTGALNFEATRIPYATGETKVGHNPHPIGRVASNVLRSEPHDDGYDKFFLIPKVRQHADEYNDHPTLKPVALMEHLVKLITFENQTILDPFMGSGSTGVAANHLNRNFIGYEYEKQYFDIAQKRLNLNKN